MVFQLHSGIAEVAAAKARMFINKPDGSASSYYLLKISIKKGSLMSYQYGALVYERSLHFHKIVY